MKSPLQYPLRLELFDPFFGGERGRGELNVMGSPFQDGNGMKWNKFNCLFQFSLCLLIVVGLFVVSVLVRNIYSLTRILRQTYCRL
jgi:hypothetical protein